MKDQEKVFNAINNLAEEMGEELTREVKNLSSFIQNDFSRMYKDGIVTQDDVENCLKDMKDMYAKSDAVIYDLLTTYSLKLDFLKEDALGVVSKWLEDVKSE